MMRKYLLILSLLISAAGIAQAPNYLYGKDVIVTTRDTSSAEFTIRNTTRNVLGYFKNIGGGKGQYTLIPQIDVTGLPDSLLARYTKTQSDARYKPIGYFPSWAEITGIPANFTTTYLLSNDVKDSIQARVKITDTINMLRPYKKPVVVAWGNSLTAGTGATVADSNYVNNLARMMGWNVINKGVSGETSTQIKTRLLAESDDTLNMPTLICAGTNNYLDSATVVNDIAEMVAKLAHQRYLILSIPNRATEGIGSAGYDSAMRINTALMNTYGDHFVDWRSFLLQFSSGTSQDNIDISEGIIPVSLRVDNVHLNDKGYRLMAQKVAKNAHILQVGNDVYYNSVHVSSASGTPSFTGRGLEMYSIEGNSYIQAFNRNPTVNLPDTLTLQFPANSVLKLAATTGNRIFLGTIPTYSSGGQRILNWNSNGYLDNIPTTALTQSYGITISGAPNNALLGSGVDLKIDTTLISTKANVTGALVAKLNIIDTATMLSGLSLDIVLANGGVSGRSATVGNFTATGAGAIATLKVGTSATQNGIATFGTAGNQYVDIVNTTEISGQATGIRFGNYSTTDNFKHSGIFYQSVGDGNSRGNLIIASSTTGGVNATPTDSVITINGVNAAVRIYKPITASSSLTATKIIGNSSTPSIAGGSSTYIGSGASTSVSGNDMAGEITLVTGTGCTSTGASNRSALSVTFSSAYTTAPIVQIQAIQQGGLSSTDGPTNQTFFLRRDAVGTNGFTVYLPVGTTLTDSTTYLITYQVIGR